MATKSSKFARLMFAGVLAAFPLIATALLITFVLGIVINWLGPSSLLGSVLSKLGLGLAGFEWVGYVLGLTIVLLALLLLGYLVEKGLQRGFTAVINGLVRKIPVVRTVYDTIHHFVHLVAKKDDQQLKSMRPIWVHFGGQGGVSALALLSSPDAVMVKDQACYAVIIPTAPIPIGGGLLYVPMDWVSPADIGMDGLTSIYVSMGLTSPQFIQAYKPEISTKS
jgi:uncharacterized membrane protein